MFPIHASMGSDPYHLGRRAVAIALRNDLHAIVAIAHRYRARILAKRRFFDRCGSFGLVTSFVLWYFAVRSGSDAAQGASILPATVASALMFVGMLCAVRGAMLRERLRDVEAVLELAIHVRETLAACAIGAYEPF